MKPWEAFAAQLPDPVLTPKQRYERERSDRWKREAFELVGGEHPACLWCGEADLDVLSLDHIRADGAEHRAKWQGPNNAYQRLAYGMDDPAVYQVLCCNCNARKRRIENRKGLLKTRRGGPQETTHVALARLVLGPDLGSAVVGATPGQGGRHLQCDLFRSGD